MDSEPAHRYRGPLRGARTIIVRAAGRVRPYAPAPAGRAIRRHARARPRI